MINYDGYGFVPPLAPPTQPLSTPPYPTTCTKTSPITSSNTDTITNTTPSTCIANKTSTSHLWLKNFMHGHLFIIFCLNKPCHTQYSQYPSELIINSSHYWQFLRWGAFHSAKTDSRLLRNLIFIPFTKVASTHSSMKYFQICWCHMVDETLSHTYLWKFPQKVWQFLIGRLFKSVNFLLRHPV